MINILRRSYFEVIKSYNIRMFEIKQVVKQSRQKLSQNTFIILLKFGSNVTKFFSQNTWSYEVIPTKLKIYESSF